MMWLDALRTLVNQYPGGRPAIALRLNKSDEVLRKELAGTSSQHKMGLSDAQHIVEVLCEQGVDCSVFRVAVNAAFAEHEVKQAACLHLLAASNGKEMAEVVSTVAASMADGHLSDNDLKRITKEVHDVVGTLTALLAASHVKHAKDNPSQI